MVSPDSPEMRYWLKMFPEHKNTIESMLKTEAMLRNNIEDKAVLIAALRRDAEMRVNTIEHLREELKEAQVDKFRIAQVTGKLALRALKVRQDLEECKTKMSSDETEVSRLRLTVQKLELKLAVSTCCCDHAVGSDASEAAQEQKQGDGDEGEELSRMSKENLELKEQLRSIRSNYEELEDAVQQLHRSVKARS
eukprot:749818-Hanusia_phi.AAC.3